MTGGAAARWATWALLAVSPAALAAAMPPGPQPEPAAEVFGEVRPLAHRNPHLRIEIAISDRFGARLEVRRGDEERRAVFAIPSPALSVVAGSDLIYVLKPRPGGGVPFERPIFDGLVIFEPDGDVAATVQASDDVRFEQLSDGRFVLYDGRLLAAYSPAGEALWSQLRPDIVDLAVVPPDLLVVTRFDWDHRRRSREAIDVRTGETLIRVEGSPEENPTVLYADFERRTAMVGRRVGSGHWRLERREQPSAAESWQVTWSHDFECNPAAYAPGPEPSGNPLQALLLTCVVDQGERFGFPNVLAVLGPGGAEVWRRELGELHAAGRYFVLEWTPDGGSLDVVSAHRSLARVDLGARP